MSTASAPNRFWGVVALALNSALQPAGHICGGTDSPALRLSPPFQIANALSLVHHSVRLSFAIGLPFRIALGVVAEKAGLYPERERQPLFRALVFVFGALPTLVKALAIRGDRVSYCLVLGFFVPFVVLELIERLAVRPTRARLAEARTMPAEKSLAVDSFRLIVALLALAIHIDVCLETLNFALMKSIFEAKPIIANGFIIGFSSLIVPVAYSSLKSYESAPKDLRSVLVVMTLGIGSFLLLCTTFQEIIHMWGHWSDIASAVLVIAVASTSTLAHLFLYLRFTSTTLRQLFSGENRHKQKFMEQWVALWTATCIFLYYGYLYDASGTYKPAWTEWLP